MKLLKLSIRLFFVILLSGIGSVHAFEPMLPQTYSAQKEISGWWMSEKLDGIRGFWDGRQLWSKNGLPFSPPPQFIAGLPPFPLEGELWGGRRTFEQTASIVLRQQPHDGWLKLQFAIFDVPGQTETFRVRIKRAQHWFENNPSPYAFVIEQIPVKGRKHLSYELNRIEAAGGEGVIIRDPDAPYQAGRSTHILKVKKSFDAEAMVIAHLPGSGRNRDRLGALLVRAEDGSEFRIGGGFSDAQRNDPPPVGSMITYKYYGHYRSGIPKFPSFLRVRADLGL